MNGAARWLPIAGVTLAASAFAWWNRGERVVVDLGVATFYRAPLSLVVFVAFLGGMVSMLLLGLRHDLRVRRELEARGAQASPARDPGPGPLPVAEPEQTLLLDPPPSSPAGEPDRPGAYTPDDAAPAEDARRDDGRALP